MESIAEQEIQRAIQTAFYWGKEESRSALAEVLERIRYRERTEQNGDYMRGFNDGKQSSEGEQVYAS